MQPAEHRYGAYLERVIDRITRTERPRVTSPYEGASQLHDRLADSVDALNAVLVELSHDIHAHPELGFAEHHAVQAVARVLGDHGVDVQVGAWDLDTAVYARIGNGQPTVALIAEYDALPEIGHACGHNVICATAVGAFLALHQLGAALEGSVALIGTPAEEGGGGKELIARAGGFDDIAAVLMLHPSGMDVAAHPWLGVRQVQVTFHGRAAHASFMPFLGHNALDAVVQTYNAISQLRQHMLPTDRIHGIITDGGQAPNIVPERASAHFYVRSAEPDTLAILSERVSTIIDAAAQATATTAEVKWDLCPPYLPVRNNRPLAARYAVNVSERGRHVLGEGVAPQELAASTDLGNISVRLPAIHPLLAIAPPEVILHTAEFARWAVSDLAAAAMLDGAVGLARTAADYLADPALRAAVSKDFDAEGGVLDVLGLLS